MRGKKILYIGNFELPDKDAASLRVIGVAKALRECGNTIFLVGADRSGEKYKKQEFGHDTKFIVEEFDCFLRKYPDSIKKWILYDLDISDYIKIIEIVGGVDVIICYNTSSLLLIRIMHYCSRHNIACTADVTEWYSVAGRGVKEKILKGIDEFFRMRVFQKKLAGLIVISSYLKHYYRNCINVVEIPPLVDISERKWEHCEKNYSEPLLLVYAGSRTPLRKDRLDYLIEAFIKISRSAELDIVGITKEEYLKLYPAHKDLISRIKNVNFHGKISHVQALEYIKRAHYSCFFRNKERCTMAGFPTKFVESLSCGTPVLTNDTSDVGKYINGRNGKILNEISTGDICDIINNLPLKIEVSSDIFDYRKYVRRFETWMK